MSVMAPLSASILARALFTATSRAVHQVPVGRLGLLELLAVLLQLALDGLQAEGELSGGFAIAGAQVGRRLGAHVLLLGLELAYLAHEPLAQAGVRRQPLVEVADLLAEVLLLELEQRFRIAPFEVLDEQGQESPEEVGHSLQHAPSWLRRPVRPCARAGG